MQNESLALRAHRLLDTDLDVKTEGVYFGVWLFNDEKCIFERKRKEPSKKRHHSDRLIYESFPLSDLINVEQLSETKNASGMAKAAIAGAVIAGPVGALAAGAFAASKNSIFVEVKLSSQMILHCHMSQVVYEKVLMSIRTGCERKVFSGINTEFSGEKYLMPGKIRDWFIGGLGFLMLIVAYFKSGII